MLNYHSIIDILKSEHYTDKTQFFGTFCRHKFNTLTNCKGIGASTFLRTFACFLDKKAASKDVFTNLDISNSEYFENEAGMFQVVYLDFSDFKAETYNKALRRINQVMASAYKDFVNDLDKGSCRHLENIVDIIALTADESTLAHSLKSILNELHHEWGNDKLKLALLIDNLINVDLEASKNGYGEEMQNFLERFIPEEVSHWCDLFLQTGGAESKHNSYGFDSSYRPYWGFIAETHDIKEYYSGLVVEPEKQHNFNYFPLEYNYDWNVFVTECRQKMEEDKLKAEKARQEAVRKEKEKYAVELGADIPRISPNLGVRHKALNKTADKYLMLNNILKEIYKETAPDFTQDKIYRYFQKIKPDKPVRYSQKQIETLNTLTTGNPYWKTAEVNDSWSAWLQITVYRGDEDRRHSPAVCQNIKAYAAMKTPEFQDVFIESLKHLADNAKDNFAAKSATCARADQMCYWLSAEDFKILKAFYEPYSQQMDKPMTFMAYSGNLAISREFMGMDDSHNSAQAHIISDYFKILDGINAVDLENMYNLYIKKWNADIYEEGYGNFKNSSAMSFIVLLDTLDAILESGDLADDSLLLSGNRDIWFMLSDCNCWKDVNDWYAKH